MSEDTDVMFRIGVMDHPQSKAALESLAKGVEDAQSRMTAGVEGIGQTINRVSSLIDALTSKLDAMAKHSASVMRGAVPPSVQPVAANVRSVTQPPTVAPASQPFRSSASVPISQQISPAPSIVAQQAALHRQSVSMSMQSQIPQPQQSRATEPIIPMPAVPTITTPISPPVVSATVPRGAMPDSVKRQTEQAEEAANEAADRIQTRFNSFDFSEMAGAMRNVFAVLGDPASEFADDISAKIDEAMIDLAQSPRAQAEVLRSAYQKMMIEQSDAFVAMSADLDGYLAKHGSTTEAIGANLRKGEANIQKYRDSAGKMAVEARTSFIEGATQIATMVKGLATIGIVSEENAEKFLKSYAVIQGSFEVIAGGARAYNAFARGVIQAREATQMLTKAQTVASAVETAQLAQVRAYHAALVQETVAANAAAGANGRLAASRAAAGASGAAAAAGSAVSGAGSAIGAGAGAAGAGGGLLRGLGGLAGGAGAATAAAGAAAAGGVYLAGRAVVESATGSATRSDSSIAALESRVGAWALRLTGLFESTDAPMVKFAQSLSSYADSILDYIPGGGMLKNMNMVGDIAGLAASQAGVERGEESLARNRIINEGNREKEAATREVDQEKGRMRFGSMVDTTRARAQAETQRFGFRDLAGDREAERTNMFNRHKMRSVKDEGALGAATVMELGGNAARMRARPSEAGTELNAEMSIFPQAVAEYAKAKSELDETLSFAGSSEKDREDAMKNATFYHDKMLDSLGRQAQLARASGAERLQIEREIQSAALSAIDQQQAKLDALNDRRKSAMKSFVDMDAVDRDMATKALEKARTGGAASLSKMETDLLGRIGTSETEQFVEESTAAKAKQLGFDGTFGRSMDMERRQIEGTRQQLEAQLQASFDVSMQVEADTDAVVDAILPRAEQAIANMMKAVESSFDQKLQQRIGEINTQITRNNIALKNR